METQKIDFLLNETAYLGVFTAVFCKQFFAYTVHIDKSAFLCNP